MTNDELIAAFGHYRRLRNLSTMASYRYRIVLGAFARECGRPLLEVTHDDIEAWLAARPHDISPRTRSSYITYLSTFYKWAIVEELTDRNPVDRVIRPKLPELLPRPIATPDLAMAVELADPRMRLFLCLGAYQGLRAHEIAKAAIEDFQLYVDPPMLRVLGKGRRERVVPLAAETERALRAYGMPRRGPLFPCHEGCSEPIRAATVTKYVARYLRSLGIEATCHQLRHWFATELQAATGDLRITQELLGHSDPSITARYAKLRPSAGAAVVRSLSARVGADPPVIR